MIRLVCYDSVSGWIIGKFAKKMDEYLSLFGVPATVSNKNIPGAAIAHHLFYGESPYRMVAPIETLMVTHLDTVEKLVSVNKKLAVFNMGICMSSDHMAHLIRCGLPPEKLCYVTPAHDGVIKPRPIVLGIASKTYADGRKNKWDIVKALHGFPPDVFKLKIMGTGWREQVNTLQGYGHLVEYYDEFDYDFYVNSFMPSLDYWLYFSHDEGSMAFQDAIAADVKIIATPQGYHLDVLRGINHVINDLHDLHMTLRKIYEERQQRTARVSRWTWAEYTWRHLIIWDFLEGSNSPGVLAEEKVFIKLLPKFAKDISEHLQYELLVRPVPEMEALLHGAKLAEKNGMPALASHYRRKALVYYPKNDGLREEVLALYPKAREFVPN